MRFANVVLVLVCGAAVVAALRIVWRDGGRSARAAPLASGEAGEDREPGASFPSAARSLVGCLRAATIAGFLVVGLGGRLVMRVLGASSGDAVQGRLTDALERVGEISFGGTMGFIVFGGLLVPVVLSPAFLLIRGHLPQRAVFAGLGYGVLLLGTVGVDDPLSSDNVDFRILAPTWLAVTLITATALLYGATFAALVARWERPRPTRSGPSRAMRARDWAWLTWCVLPPVLVLSAVYLIGWLAGDAVNVRAVGWGRAGHRLVTLVVGVLVALSAVEVVQAGTEIV